MELMADRAFISRGTLARAERGDPGVAMGIYASILFVLGLADRIAELVEPGSDRLGLALEDERLPRRIRTNRG